MLVSGRVIFFQIRLWAQFWANLYRPCLVGWILLLMMGHTSCKSHAGDLSTAWNMSLVFSHGFHSSMSRWYRMFLQENLGGIRVIVDVLWKLFTRRSAVWSAWASKTCGDGWKKTSSSVWSMIIESCHIGPRTLQGPTKSMKIPFFFARNSPQCMTSIFFAAGLNF